VIMRLTSYSNQSIRLGGTDSQILQKTETQDRPEKK
jgi:hypothetical protein